MTKTQALEQNSPGQFVIECPQTRQASLTFARIEGNQSEREDCEVLTNQRAPKLTNSKPAICI